LDACRREIREELGFDLPIGDLLVVDWVPAHGVWYDGLMFIFDGGVLADEQIEQIDLDAAEARSHTFLSLEEAGPRLKPSLARRFASAEAARRRAAPTCAQFGRIV
jgi:ADP-ribose pyrophosphatase YjhB (NUDIX family)